MELERLNADKTDAATEKATVNKPKRRLLPDHLHTIRIEHEPASTQCSCGCQLRRIGEDISEKLHFRPAQFYKEQHVRGKWVCDQCDTLTQQAMPAYVIDKGIASPELLSHVLVSKYADHLPLYRQRLIYQRAGIELSRSTLSDWIGRCGVELEPLANALKEVVLMTRVEMGLLGSYNKYKKSPFETYYMGGEAVIGVAVVCQRTVLITTQTHSLFGVA